MKVTITLEFDDANADDETLKEAVYQYLEQLIADDSLDFEVEN